MKDDFGNIYKRARKTTVYSQEAWAGLLGVSVEAVRQYENGTIMPAEDILLTMAEISGLTILPYWHLQKKSRIAGAILPELEEQKGLPEAVLALLIQVEEFQANGMRALMRIAQDGRVDEDEAEAYDEAIRQLQRMIRKAYELGYAKK